MASLDEITEQFDEFGIQASPEVLAKCIELCVIHSIVDAAEFVEQWMAYSVSHLEGADPTVPYLLDMERKQLTKSKESSTKKAKPQTPLLRKFANASLHSPMPGAHLDPIDDDQDDELMDTYGCNTPKASRKTLPRTPATQKIGSSVLSQSGYSPITGTPRSSGTEGSGKAVYTFGKANVIENTTWTTCRQQKLPIVQLLTHDKQPMTTKAKYMYDNLTDKSIHLEDRLYSAATDLCKKHLGNDLNEYNLKHANTVNQDKVQIVGRIACDYDGKLDRNSTIIVDTEAYALRTARLNFDHLKSFAVFPGQTVLLTGTNPRGDTFYVHEIVADRHIAPPSVPEISEPLTLVFAAGPFTNSDDLVYDPLNELILYCKDNKPDVLVLIGPFMDAEHKLIASNVLTESFDVFFEKMIAGLVESLGDITICMVSSQKDAFSQIVYPTPPNVLRRSFPNVHMLPDPCIIDVDSLKVGITSTDIFSHLLEEELERNAGEKVKRVVNYMLNGRSFYPLNPPSLDVCLDSDLASKYARLDEPPNLLILPSKEKCFIRDINNCLTINPGSLSGNNPAGIFARVTVHPPKDGARLADYIASQVVRI